MAMGFNAAYNIHQQILHNQSGTEPKFVKWLEVPPMMGLAIGKKAICFGGPEGVIFGEQQMQWMLYVFPILPIQLFLHALLMKK